MSAARDWADTEDHDYLNELVGRRITRVTTGTNPERGLHPAVPWLRLTLEDGRVFEVSAEADPSEAGMASLGVQDFDG